MFAPDISINQLQLGNEGQPLVIVDNFFSAAEPLAAAAHSRPFKSEHAFYPGLRSAAPNQYLRAIHTLAVEALTGVFGFKAIDLISIDSVYSYVTTTPGQLKPYQRIPHFDIPFAEGIACVHYLFPNSSGFGGTSFYRHNSTGFEFIDEGRITQYMAVLDEEIASCGLPEPAQYITGDTALFTRHMSCEPKFNRILFYRACMLHSGNIFIDHDFDAAPLNNRLTVTTFIKIGNNH